VKKTLTLKKNIEFKNIFNRGKWYDGKVLSVYIMPNSKKYNLLGIAVGKKTAKSVKRNRIRRIIREAYRLNEERINKGISIIIVWKIKKDINEATFENINSDIIRCFEKAGVLNNEETMHIFNKNISEDSITNNGQ
jgi:ribonuclease P protein component